ncbi:protein YpfM [Salmonella enterica subsp. enterica serovar Typhi]|uniref:protein YpfM n=1 Tax=Salmonella enterica TaxID=28901 RepID=UPI00300DFD20
MITSDSCRGQWGLGNWGTGELGNWGTGELGNWGTGELGNWKDFIEVMLRK